MRYAILSDAHGNKPYFEECIAAIDMMEVQHLIYLGDIFGYMPDGISILNTLKNKGAYILKGNHEAMLLGEISLDMEKDRIYRLEEQKNLINKSDMLFLGGLHTSIEVECKGGKVFLVHGAPFDILNGYLYEDDHEYLWEDGEYRFVFMGHTHRPYIKHNGGTTYVNVGSCGLPRDIGLAPSFCVFDDEELTVEIKRIQINPKILESEYYSGVNNKVLEVLRRK